MAIFVPVISSNAMHADHKPKNLGAWFKGGGLIRAISAMAQVPCSISVEGFDLELLPDFGDFVRKHKGPGEFINGEWSHILPWFFIHADGRMIVRNFTHHGPDFGHPVHFVSEYSSLPHSLAKALVDKTKQTPAIYTLDSATTVYSDFAQNDGPLRPLAQFSQLEGVHAMLHDGIMHMRMYMDLAKIPSDKFLGFQRLRDAKGKNRVTARDVVDAMKTAVDAADKRRIPVVFWPMDIESCVIGSNYGPSVYEDLAEALQGSGLPLAGPRQAYELLLPMAQPSQALYREVNNKWGGFPNQEVLRTDQTIMVHELRDKQLSAFERKLELLGIGSDAYVWRKFQNKDVKQITLPTDLGEITFCGENKACHLITQAVRRHFRPDDKRTFTECLEEYLVREEDALLRLTLEWARKHMPA